MTITPPLLVAMAGRKPRLRKAQVPIAKEDALHIPVANLLRAHAKPDWRWTHVAHGGMELPPRTAAKLKAMGLRPGWPDFILISPMCKFHCLELKSLKGRLSDDQKDFRDWCDKHGTPYVVCRTIDEVLTIFGEWECIEGMIYAAHSPR